jgi:hypothetical protein
MSATDSILNLARTYGAALQLEPSQVSWRVFADTKKLSAIENGGDLQTKRFEKAVQWFADNWPETAVWPEGVERPLGRVTAESA